MSPCDAAAHLARAVGHVFQTPEMHRLHHRRGHHKHNYSDIVCWDMLFGTYVNPLKVITACGFDAVAEQEVFRFLLGKNIRPS